MQEVGNNNNDITQQNNFGSIQGDVRLTPKTRWQKRIEKLQEEVKRDKRYESLIEDFNTNNTIQDGIGL